MKIQERIGTIFASFLPGICIRIVQSFLLAENLKTLNHKLICASLELLTHVIKNVFDDNLLDVQNAKACYNECIGSGAGGTEVAANVKSLMIDRVAQPEWTVMSSQKLLVLVERLIDALIIQENTNIHLYLVNFCGEIADKCYFTLNEYLGILLRYQVL